MQVFDLTRLRDVRGEPAKFTPDFTYDRINSAHNIVINEESGFAYAVGSGGGGETCGGGLHMIDIREPKNPKFAGCFADPQTGSASTGYSHDAQCVTSRGPDERYSGREICLGSNETALSIADVTDKENPRALSRASYPNVQYAHQGWLTDDHRYFYMNDEGDEMAGVVPRTRTLIWDLADLEDPQFMGEFLGETRAIDHNLYIKGNLMYQSNYVSGLRIIDISNREQPVEVGYFDTLPFGENDPVFSGSWSNYPYFESGIIAVSSIGEGLFLVKKRNPATVF
jgi:choice-of-anchor B domain-containing protein